MKKSQLNMTEDTKKNHTKVLPVKFRLLNSDIETSKGLFAGETVFSNATQKGREYLRQKRGETTLIVDCKQTEFQRIREQHPLLPLQFTLLKEHCLLNMLDVVEIDGTFGY